MCHQQICRIQYCFIYSNLVNELQWQCGYKIGHSCGYQVGHSCFPMSSPIYQHTLCVIKPINIMVLTQPASPGHSWFSQGLPRPSVIHHFHHPSSFHHSMHVFYLWVKCFVLNFKGYINAHTIKTYPCIERFEFHTILKLLFETLPWSCIIIDHTVVSGFGIARNALNNAVENPNLNHYCLDMYKFQYQENIDILLILSADDFIHSHLSLHKSVIIFQSNLLCLQVKYPCPSW